MASSSRKRIMQEHRQFLEDPQPDVIAFPLESNMHEWHFTIKGPPDSEFEGGLYHGRILLPADYPFKPPDIIMLTPSGRFVTGSKICLSITGYHPKNWQPTWGIRTTLVALRSFLVTPGRGAIGAIDCPKAERRKLARKSVRWKCPECDMRNCDFFEDEEVEEVEEEVEEEEVVVQEEDEEGVSEAGGEVEDGDDEDVLDDAEAEEIVRQALLGLRQRQGRGGGEVERDGGDVDQAEAVGGGGGGGAAAAAAVALHAAAHRPRRSDTFLSFLTIFLSVAIFVLLARKVYAYGYSAATASL